MPNFIDLTGQRFHRLTAKSSFVEKRPSGKKVTKWQCICDCGKSTFVLAYKLSNGSTRSCGCLQKEVAASRRAKHNMSGSFEYSVWVHILVRCYNKNYKHFANYGGRGIDVCPDWVASFSKFYRHVGPAPSNGYSIDRIDNDKGYWPGNVRWATRKEQSRNTRRNVNVTVFDRVMCISDAAELYGINRDTVMSRISRGWPVDDALKTPPQSCGYRHRTVVRRDA